MMKKYFNLFLLVLVFVFFLAGCGADLENQYESGAPSGDDETEYSVDGLPERKIIYSVELSIYTKDLQESISILKANLNDDEWFDYEHIEDRKATFKMRIKSDRLDSFINDINSSYDVSFYSKTGEDISLDYLDTTNRIAALEAQHDRLVALYENASLSEMITINERLGEIEAELLSLQGTLNNFDSLVDYSEVEVTIYQSVASSRSPFFNRLVTSLGNGFNAVLTFLDYIIMALATILPFAIIALPVSGGALYISKRSRLKKEKNREKK